MGSRYNHYNRVHRLNHQYEYPAIYPCSRDCVQDQKFHGYGLEGYHLRSVIDPHLVLRVEISPLHSGLVSSLLPMEKGLELVNHHI